MHALNSEVLNAGNCDHKSLCKNERLRNLLTECQKAGIKELYNAPTRLVPGRFFYSSIIMN